MNDNNNFPDNLVEEIDAIKSKFPSDKSKSAIIESLLIIQHHNNGYLDEDLISSLADFLNVTKIDVYEVATFYSMFNTKPVGRNNVAICTNISCMLRGADEIVDHVEKKLNIKLGESTDDGRIYLKKEEECLAACCGAPMMMVNHEYYENLTIEKIEEILGDLE